MNTSTTNVTSIFVESSPTEKNPSTNNRNNINLELIQTSRKSKTRPPRRLSQDILENLYLHQPLTFSKLCAFILFTVISMAAGITIVCLTASKTNPPCTKTFKRTIQGVITYDSRPRHVAIGDLNGDNHPDLVIANSGVDNIAVRLASSKDTFENQTFYSTGVGSQPYWVAVKDLNNDNLLDIVVANYGNNNIGVFLGNGDGSFASKMIFSLGASRPLSLAIADFNDDHQWDIAVVNNYTFDVKILLGVGNGTFQAGAMYHMGYDSMPCSIAVADMNNDNQSDIIVVNYGTSELVVLFSNGNQTFSISRYSTGKNSHPTSVTLDYLNSDDYMDIAITNSATHNVGVFLGSSNGTFTSMRQFPMSENSHLQFIATSLFSNESKHDLIVVDSNGNQVVIMEGDGNGLFTISKTLSTGYASKPYSIAVADLDHDYRSDIVVVNYGINDIRVYSSYTFQTTANETTYSTGAYSTPNFVTVADVNHDTHLDIVVANTGTSDVVVFIGLGDGVFQSQQTLSIGSNEYEPYSFALGDFNGDSLLDMAMAISYFDTTEIYFGQRNGTFKYGSKYTVHNDTFPISIITADLNNDQILDMATVNNGGNDLAVFLGNNDGTFLEAVYYNISDDFYPIFLAVGDINNDGFPDLVSTNGQKFMIAIFLNNGDGTFRNSSSIYLADSYPSWIVLADLDNDTLLDIIFSSPDYPTIGILRGKRNGTFEEVYPYELDDDAILSSVALGYFNTDNILDIAIVDALDSSITLFFRSADEDLSSQNTILLVEGDSPYWMAAGDFNNDNQTDIVLANSESNDISVLLLKDEISFKNLTTYRQGSGAHPYSITAGDFNNDSQLDIVVANSGRDNVQIFTGYRNGTFTNNITYSTGDNSNPRSVVTGDFDKNNQLDIAVATYRGHTVIVILNAGNETMHRSISYSTGARSFPNSLAIGDLNKDGWTDIVVSHSNTDSIGMFLGFDYSRFTNDDQIQSARGSFPYGIAAGFFNQDAQWDLAIVYRQTGTIDIFTGNGDGTFVNKSSNPVGNSYDTISFTTGDFNNDSQLDIVAANLQNGSIRILLGNGDGTFTNHTNKSTNDLSPVFITVGYLNNDHVQDLVVAYGRDDKIGVLLGYGNGLFAEQILYSMPSGSYPICIAIADFNKDNISDLVVANRGRHNIDILLGYGNGTFQSLRSYSTGIKSAPRSIAIGDFNKDSHIDIAVANSGTKTVRIFFGYDNGTFLSEVSYSTHSNLILMSITAEDLNNDTILDLVITNSGDRDGNIAIFYGLVDGKFLVPKTYFTELKIQIPSIVIRDFNNDGWMDIAVSIPKKDKVNIMLRNKSEPFGLQVSFRIGNGSNPSAVAVSDLNNDGQLDIAVACYQTNDIRISLGDGNGNFAQWKRFLTGPRSLPNSLAIGDIDGDEQYDIVVSNSNTDEIGIFFGFGTGSFDLVKTYYTGQASRPSSVGIADLNHDNQIDIVVANSDLNTVLVLFATGNKTFFKSESYPFNYDHHPRSVYIGDFNNDNLLDIAVATYESGYVDILLHVC